MRILLVVHGFPPAASGGTEVYVRDFAAALAASGDDVMVLTHENDAHRPELRVRTSADGPVRVTTINNTFQSCESFEESYAHPAIERLAGDVLDEWRPDVVHVQHLTCLSTRIPRQAALRAIPVVPDAQRLLADLSPRADGRSEGPALRGVHSGADARGVSRPACWPALLLSARDACCDRFRCLALNRQSIWRRGQSGR